MRTAALIVTFVFAATGCQLGNAAPASNLRPSPTPNEAPTIGEPVRDGEFEFKVTKVGTSKRVSSKDSGENIAAEGRFVIVRITVTNRSDDPRYFVADEQKLQAAGTTYSPDIDATVTVDKGPEIGLPEEVNPDASERVTVVFDVPKNAKPAGIELHDTAESEGTEVTFD